MALDSLWRWSTASSASPQQDQQIVPPTAYRESGLKPLSQTATRDASAEQQTNHSESPRADTITNDATNSSTTSSTTLKDQDMQDSIAVMPSTMSCTGAFDTAMACGGFGGSFNGVYRYGAWRDCSTQWADWRFCMRLRVLPNDENKKQMIREHYWNKEVEMRKRPNSEDIWQERTQRAQGFFQKDPDQDGTFEGLWARAPEELEEKE